MAKDTGGQAVKLELTGSAAGNLNLPDLGVWHPTGAPFWNLVLLVVLVVGVIAIWRELA